MNERLAGTLKFAIELSTVKMKQSHLIQVRGLKRNEDYPKKGQ